MNTRRCLISEGEYYISDLDFRPIGDITLNQILTNPTTTPIFFVKNDFIP
jgi:hypothetical protein